MEKIKKMLIITLIIMLIIIAIIIIILTKNKEEEQNLIFYPDNEDTEIMNEEGKNTFQYISDYRIYYTIKTIFENYVEYIKQINGDKYVDTSRITTNKDEIATTLKKEGIDAMKSIFDNEYIEDINISDEDILNIANEFTTNGNYDKEVLYKIEMNEIYTIDIDEYITLALVSGKINNEDINLIVKLDIQDETYSIFLENYIEKYGYNKDMNKEKIAISKEKISENEYNSQVYAEATQEYIIMQHFDEYRRKMLYYPEEAYEQLNQDYSNKKYNSYEKFKQYLEKNKNKIMYSSITKYQVVEGDNKKYYIGIDNNLKYYIFIEEKIGEYTVMLDSYTVDLPEIQKEYKNGSNEDKIKLNIGKFINMLMDEAYESAYNLLDETYKNNNFKTLESYQYYIDRHFYKTGYYTIDSIIMQGNNYIVKITTRESEDTSSNAVTSQIIMNLGTDTNFTMAISLE